MKFISTIITGAVAAASATVALAAGSPGVERNTQAFLEAMAKAGGRPFETLTPGEARTVLATVQAGAKLAPTDVSEKAITVDGKQLKLTIVRPAGVKGVLPGFMFFHGGGWVLGDFPTNERFVRDLVADSGAAAVFVNYSLSPEVGYPVAINEAYAATKWVAENGAQINVDGKRLAVAGNSVGGNIAAVVALMAKAEGGPALRAQLLFWPATNANFENASYDEFATDHFLTKNMMKWFWDAYTMDAGQRRGIYASPLLAAPEQLKGLPPSLIQTAEMDVLRDEAEAYARKLDAAGVDVVNTRYNGMIHDFAAINALSNLPASRAAMHQASEELKVRLR
jgi:acetyl esterase/lipase